ncbi:MAG TPA: deoxyribodipyrimidine photo-lyase [Candidatus Deferrimicrobiaceae bacterium]|nr:deoxyribodipyrimidine photo-lyase [Candidatus Deferrimicrobiaceae bacterium]
MARPTTAVVWFRRDLRVHDHPALAHALGRYDRIVPLFVVDDRILDGRWPSANRRWFLAGAVRALSASLKARGAGLAVLRGDPIALVPRVAAQVGASAIVASRDYAPYGRRRDAAVAAAAGKRGIAFEAGRGLLVHEPDELRRSDGAGFSVFSAFHRRWLDLSPRAIVEAPSEIRPGPRPRGSRPDVDGLLPDVTPTALLEHLPEPTEQAARSRLHRWSGSAALHAYDRDRDRLDIDGSSRLSQDLRWGLLSPVEVLARCGSSGAGPARFRSELAWRDFYAHLLWDRPELARRSARPELELAWRRPDPDQVAAWMDGRTGYPVVDAAMRQLRATGWLPNRARMIVASFLTKHLLVDWRIGEAYFMAHLLDGDPASNNGGWQWVASTGVDAQPPFRIFNPTLQGRRHDPEGTYVRRWVPELAGRPDLRGLDIHAPPRGAYLPPLVQHGPARAAALAAFAGLRRRQTDS